MNRQCIWGEHSLFPSTKVVKVLGSLTVLGLSIKYVHNKIEDYKERRELTLLRRKRQEERNIQLSELESRFPLNAPTPTFGKWEEIIKLTFREVQQKLGSKELSAIDVLSACIWKSIQVQKDFNCVTEFLMDALDKAKQLDQMSVIKGPLHGIPFCVKDDTAMKGYDCTLGCSRNLYKPENETAVIVQSLEQLGAIPFCRTNCPQTCCSGCSSNPIFGRTINPLNGLSPGGSSSGTGCLVKGGGCWFGTGSDTGGSLRIPAAFCGLVTLKCTANRISKRGCKRCADKLVGVPGILANNVDTLSFVHEHLLEQNNLMFKMDPTVVPIPWNLSVFQSFGDLRIGYISSFDGFFPLIGDTLHVVETGRSILESRGHTLVPLDYPNDFDDFCSVWNDEALQEQLKKLLKGDMIDDIMKSAIDGPAMNCDHIFANRDKNTHLFFDAMNKADIDIVIWPAWSFPAINYDDFIPGYKAPGGYTFIGNWFDLPSGIVPIMEESGREWKDSLNGLDDKVKEVFLRDEDKCKGMPICIQVVGKPYQEELVMRVMAELESGRK